MNQHRLNSKNKPTCINKESNHPNKVFLLRFTSADGLRSLVQHEKKKNHKINIRIIRIYSKTPYPSTNDDGEEARQIPITQPIRNRPNVALP